MDAKLQEILQRIEGLVGQKDYETMKALLESYAYIAELVNEEGMTTERLWEMVYGPSNEQPLVVVRGTNSEGSAGGDRVDMDDA